MASTVLCRGLSDEIQTRHLLVLQEANREEEGFLIKDGIVVVTKGKLGSRACCSEERTLTKARLKPDRPLRVFAPVCFAKKAPFRLQAEQKPLSACAVGCPASYLSGRFQAT